MIPALVSMPPSISLLLPTLFLSIVSITLPSLALGGAWLRAPGESYVKAALFRSRGVEEFDVAGNARPLFDPAVFESGAYRETGSSLYAEYGLAPDVTLVAGLLLKVAELDARDREVAGDLHGLSIGIPDLQLGARLPLARGRWAAALEPSLSIPLRAVDRANDDSPRIGSESASFALGAALGRSLPIAGGYAQLSAGYRARAGSSSDEWFGDAEVGVSPIGPLRLRLRYDRVDARRVAIGMEGDLSGNAGARDAGRLAPTIALGSRGGIELSLTWRPTISGRSALRGSEWELAYAFLGSVKR